MNDRGNQGQSGASGQRWNKSKDRLGQIAAACAHRWHAV